MTPYDDILDDPDFDPERDSMPVSRTATTLPAPADEAEVADDDIPF